MVTVGGPAWDPPTAHLQFVVAPKYRWHGGNHGKMSQRSRCATAGTTPPTAPMMATTVTIASFARNVCCLLTRVVLARNSLAGDGRPDDPAGPVPNFQTQCLSFWSILGA